MLIRDRWEKAVTNPAETQPLPQPNGKPACCASMSCRLCSRSKIASSDGVGTMRPRPVSAVYPSRPVRQVNESRGGPKVLTFDTVKIGDVLRQCVGARVYGKQVDRTQEASHELCV